MFNKLKEDFENNPLPDAVEMPTMTITEAITGPNADDEFTQLPQDDDDQDESTSLAVRMALNQKHFEEEKDDKLDQIMADIREFELTQIRMEEEKSS